MSIIPYVRMARPSHWIKNIFVLPGIMVAVMFKKSLGDLSLLTLVAGILSPCLMASANYVINEWLDARYDRHHPEKRGRPAATGQVRLPAVIAEYVLLAAGGLLLSAAIHRAHFLVSLCFLAMGIIYNMPPLRSKERAVVDVLSESINNPIRFMLGWTMVAPDYLPPVSALLGYWMGGAFLMAVKRLAELRHLGDRSIAVNYRKSFGFYTEERLLASILFYAMCSLFFLGVFLVKYRIELLISMPFVAVLFCQYLLLGYRHDSSAQKPEKLYKEKGLFAYMLFLAALMAVLLFVDMPVMTTLLNRMLIAARWGP